MKNYSEYMQRALKLAAAGWGVASPNPMVGAVILKGDRVVGEGYHEGPGSDHAEIIAIRKAGLRARGAELVINLEPCCHYGRTPPCVDKIIKSGIRHVVYGIKDPNPLVNGGGLLRLKKAGIKVSGPVLPKESSSLNRIYIHWMKTGRPYVISKVALSLDGKIATKEGDSKWITSEKCRERMHYWRSGVDAVLVGAETVRKDDPLLNARCARKVRQPRPVVVTTGGEIALDKRIWKRQPVVVCKDSRSCDNLRKIGAEVIAIKGSGDVLDWGLILEALGKIGISSVLVEGGGKVHAQVLKERVANYMIASMSTKLIGGEGKDWLPGFGVGRVSDSPRINPDQILVLDDNVIIEGRVEYGV